VKVPGPLSSTEYAARLLDGANVLVTPGKGFGAAGEGYFRIALTQPVHRIEEAIDRLGRL
jgi:LL-diaminopimelate aminotransferase